MLPYLILFFTVSSLCVIGQFSINPIKKALFLTTILILILFAGLRGVVGTDTASYLLLYEKIDTIDVSNLLKIGIEPGFLGLLAIHKKIFNSESFYILFIAIIEGIILYGISKNCRNRFVFILCFTLIFYLNFNFNTIRSAIASLLFLYGICGKAQKIKLVALILAPLFHLTIIPFYLIFALRNNRKLARIAIILIIILILTSVESLNQYYDKYTIYNDIKSSIKISTILLFTINVLPVILSIIIIKNRSFYFTTFSYILISTHAVYLYYPIGYRFISMSTLFYMYFLIESLSINKFRFSIILLWIPVTFGFYSNIVGMANESTNLQNRITQGEDLDLAITSTFIPYKLQWDDQNIKN